MSILDQVKSIPHGLSIITRWLGSGGNVCGLEEAQRRADICLKCKNNVQGMALSSAVATAVKTHLEVKNKLNLRVKGEKSLGACAVCTCQLRLLIHEPIDKVRSEIQPGEVHPGHCWKIAP